MSLYGSHDVRKRSTRVAEPGNDLRGIAIDLAHELNLVISLNEIRLVDADLVCPEDATFGHLMAKYIQEEP